MPQGDEADSPIWPSADYQHQVTRLREAIGQRIHIVELEVTETQIGIRYLGQTYVLLDLVDFPRPDPARGIAPHLLLLDDGRGVNLGRIARVSVERAFSPTAAQILYQDREALQGLLFRDRQLSQAYLERRSRQILREMLGPAPETPDLSLRSDRESD